MISFCFLIKANISFSLIQFWIIGTGPHWQWCLATPKCTTTMPICKKMWEILIWPSFTIRRLSGEHLRFYFDFNKMTCSDPYSKFAFLNQLCNRFKIKLTWINPMYNHLSSLAWFWSWWFAFQNFLFDCNPFWGSLPWP